MLGMAESRSRSSFSTTPRRSSSPAMRDLLALTWAFADSASSLLPSRMSWPTCLEMALRSACSFSTSTMTERRSSSRSKNLSRSQWAFWRDAQDSSTASGCSLTNLMSSILLPLRIETARLNP